MSFILNLTALPLLALAAVMLMYVQIGFFVAFLIATWRSLHRIRNIQYIVLYLVAMAFAAGLAYLIMKLTTWIGVLADGKMWGYIGSCVIFLFTTWKLVPQFTRVALEQTESKD